MAQGSLPAGGTKSRQHDEEGVSDQSKIDKKEVITGYRSKNLGVGSTREGGKKNEAAVEVVVVMQEFAASAESSFSGNLHCDHHSSTAPSDTQPHHSGR